MRRNKKLTTIISIIIILAIISVVFAYLFIATDTFRSSQELFGKYFSQNKESLEKIFDLKTVEVYENLEIVNKYESNTNVTMLHSEGGEVSNPLNNLALKLDVQKNDEEQYMYADGQILFENEEYLESEIIKEQEQYGIRFTDAVKQFITVKDDENLEAVANDLGIDVAQIQALINMIDGSEQTAVEAQLSVLKDKYLNIVTTAISNGTFEKQKNAMITYNNVTTKTNAYSVQLTSEQVGNMLIEILNNIKSETEILDKLQSVVDEETVEKLIDDTINKINEELEIPTIKIAVYEQKQKTIRTDIEIGFYKISIENVEQNEEIKTKINYSDLNNDQVIQYNSEIIKKNTENQEDFQIIINATEGEENYTITISNQMRLSDNKIELDTEISHKQNITTTSLLLENEVNIGADFEKAQSLVSGNYISLNNLQEEKRKQLIDLLNQIVPQKTIERINLLKDKFGLNDSETQSPDSQVGEVENTEVESEVSQIEINKFNAKFEFYTGEEVSAENVKKLLDIVKNNLNSYEIITSEPLEDAEIQEAKTNIKLYIEENKTNEEGITKTLERIDDDKKYKVLIVYKQSNGLIDYITISEM